MCLLFQQISRIRLQSHCAELTEGQLKYEYDFSLTIEIFLQQWQYIIINRMNLNFMQFTNNDARAQSREIKIYIFLCSMFSRVSRDSDTVLCEAAFSLEWSLSLTQHRCSQSIRMIISSLIGATNKCLIAALEQLWRSDNFVSNKPSHLSQHIMYAFQNRYKYIKISEVDKEPNNRILLEKHSRSMPQNSYRSHEHQHVTTQNMKLLYVLLNVFSKPMGK